MKKALLVFTAASALVLAGCGANNSSSNSSDSSQQSSTQKQDTVVEYQKLGKSDKKLVKFDLSTNKDNDDNDYDVSMTIKNKTKKSISFDPAQFTLLVDGVQRATSDEDDKVTVKAGQQITIDELFEDVTAETLNSDKLTVEYINSKNVVAKPDLSVAMTDNSQTQTAVDNSATSSVDDSDDQEDRLVNSPEQAISMYQASYGLHSDPADYQVSEVSGGYQVVNKFGKSAIVSYNGDITDENGVKSYADYANANG